MEGRALFLTPAVCEVIQERFIPFARNCLAPSGHAGDDAFWAKVRSQNVSTGNNMFLCSASGKVVPGDRFLSIWLAAWAKLPESERKPGAVQVEPRGPYQPNPRSPQPPAEGLIVATYCRALDRDNQGRLSAPEKLSLGISRTVIKAEPNRDFLWLTKQEWQSLVPAGSKKHDRFAVPEVIRDRIFRFHLVDGACCLPGFHKPNEILSGELMLTVTEASPTGIQMHLQGSAKLGAADRYTEFDIRGALNFDRRRGSFTRFDAVALSKAPCHRDTATGKLMPLGIAFELSRGKSPADQRPPYRIWYDGDGLKDYFGTGG